MKKIYTLTLLIFSCSLFAQDSLNMSLLYHWDDPNLVGSNFYDNTYNEVWGFKANSREFAVIGSTWGTHIFDITNGNNVQYVDSIPGAVQGGVIIHRDFHDYAGYLYIVADEGNSSTLQIVDVSTLPDSSTIVYDSNALFNKSHNIYIDTTSAKMYVCGGGSNKLSVYSLANPVNPVLLVDCNQSVGFWNQIGYVHDIYVENDTAYINAGNTGFFIVDFTNTTNPTLLASLTSYVHQGYNHSGWMHPTQNVYALADETHGMKIKLIDVNDMGNLSVIDTIGSDEHPLSIAHNLIFKGDFLYVSYYYDGVYIFDVSDANNATVAGFYHTSSKPHINSYEGAWGVYPFYECGKLIVSDMQEGLFVFDVSDATGDDYSVTADYNNNTNGLSVDFTDISTGGVDEWDWDFGDSNTSTQQNPSHTYATAGSYQVCLTTTNGCDTQMVCKDINVAPVGVKEQLTKSYKVFPNPFHDNITVQTNEPIQYRLLDYTGKQVKSGTINPGNTTLPAGSGIPAGIYTLELLGTQKEMHKLVRVE